MSNFRENVTRITNTEVTRGTSVFASLRVATEVVGLQSYGFGLEYVLTHCQRPTRFIQTSM